MPTRTALKLSSVYYGGWPNEAEGLPQGFARQKTVSLIELRAETITWGLFAVRGREPIKWWRSTCDVGLPLHCSPQGFWL